MLKVRGRNDPDWRAPDAQPPTGEPSLYEANGVTIIVPAGPAPRRHRAAGRPGWRALAVPLAALTGGLVFMMLTDGGELTRPVTPLLPELSHVAAYLGLGLDQVAVSGQRFTPDGDIFDALELKNVTSMVEFDGAAAQARIEALPWVETAVISRLYPSTLDIRIRERTPTAIWSRDGRDYLIDRTGRQLSAAPESGYDELPRVAGAGAAAEAADFLETIGRYRPVAERFERADRVAGRRWRLHLSRGVVIELAAGREASSLEALTSDPLLIKAVSVNNRIIDLRTPGRIVTRAAGAKRARSDERS